MTRFIAWMGLLTGFLLIEVGGYISSSGYGLAIPDWPTSNGQLIPSNLVGGIAFEFSHRLAALLALFLVFLLVIMLRGNSNRRLSLFARLTAVTIVLQTVLGGVGVLVQFPWGVKILHSFLAQVFVGLMAGVIVLLSSSQTNSSPVVVNNQDLRRLRAFCSMLLLQIVTGAVVRHSEVGIVFGLSLALHILLAVGVAVTGVMASRKIAAQAVGCYRALSYTILIGVVLQVVLGMQTVLTRPGSVEAGQVTIEYMWTALTHVNLGALLLACGMALYLRMAQVYEATESV
jgi:cytochrome c oxidase assembly protein subunit 15